MTEFLLLKTISVLDDCNQHLISFKKADSEVQKESPLEAIENYLTQHLLIVLCAEIEELVCRYLSSRASKSKDLALEALVDSWAKKIVRSVRYEDLVGIIRVFGEEYEIKFKSMVDEPTISSYGLAVKKRHITAHSLLQNQVTMEECKKGINSAEKIINAFQKTLLD